MPTQPPDRWSRIEPGDVTQAERTPEVVIAAPCDVTGAAVPGGDVAEAAVPGGDVTEAAVPGGDVTGAAVPGGDVTEAAVPGGYHVSGMKSGQNCLPL